MPGESLVPKPGNQVSETNLVEGDRKRKKKLARDPEGREEWEGMGVCAGTQGVGEEEGLLGRVGWRREGAGRER